MAKSPKRPPEGEGSALLGRPRLLLLEPSKGAQYLFSLCLTALGTFGAFSCMLTAFELEPAPLVLCAVGLCCCALWGLGLLGRRWRLGVSLGALLLWGAGLWLCWEWVAQGFTLTANQMLDLYGERLALQLPKLDYPYPGASRHGVTLFFSFLLPPVTWLLSWVWVQGKSALGAFCVTGAFLLSSMAVSIRPAWWALGILLLFWCLLLFTASPLGQRHKLLDERGTFRAAGSAAARPGNLLLLPLLALALAAVYFLFPQETYERPQVVADLRQGLTQGFGLGAGLKGGVASGNRGVDLERLGDRSYTGQTVLRVLYDWEGDWSAAPNAWKDYLKSFVGSVYTGSRWERLSGESLSRLEELTEGFSPQTVPARLEELFPAGGMSGLLPEYELTVENVAGNPRLAFLPYGLSLSPQVLEGRGIELVEDGFGQSVNWLSGTREYQLSSLCAPTPAVYRDRVFSGVFSGDLYTTVQRLYDSYQDSQDLPRENLAEQGEWAYAAAYDQLLQALWAGKNNSQDNGDLWQAPQWLLDTFDSHTASFLTQLEAYNAFVYETYTQLPDGLGDYLEEYRRKTGLVALGQQQLAESLVNYFQNNFTYTLTPDQVPEGEDFVKWFLEDSKTGYCVHFATAAVALLRSAGIPARYAEGYAVPADKSGQWVNVPDYNAHAWVEYWSSGAGWIPLEVTPSGPDAPAASYNAQIPVSNGTPAPAAPTPTPAPVQTPAPAPSQQSTPSPTQSQGPAPSPGVGGGQEGGSGFPWLRLLAVVGALAAFVLALILRRQLALARRRRAFTQQDRNQAALAAYAHLLRLWPLLQKGEAPSRWEELALKARFSAHTLTQDELEELTAAAAGLERELSKSLSPAQRLWRQYGQALF